MSSICTSRYFEAVCTEIKSSWICMSLCITRSSVLLLLSQTFVLRRTPIYWEHTWTAWRRKTRRVKVRRLKLPSDLEEKEWSSLFSKTTLSDILYSPVPGAWLLLLHAVGVALDSNHWTGGHFLCLNIILTASLFGWSRLCHNHRV